VLHEEHHRVVEEGAAQARCCDEQAGRELRGHETMLPFSKPACHSGSCRISQAAVDILAPLRSASRTLAVGAWTASVVYGHRAIALVRPDIDNPVGKRPFIACWSRGMFPIFGVDLALVGGALPEGGPFLVVTNHRSPLDILVCVHLVGGVVLSHHGVAKIPVIGEAARATDTIFVDRADQRSGARAIREMRRRLREGLNVIAFPEGTTFAGDEVRPFKRGAFSAAKGLDVKVLPIGLAYEPGCEFVDESFGRHLLRMSARRRTSIWACIGDPMPVPSGQADEEGVRRAIQALVDRAAAARESAREP
jgi:1-acyl-sn-glycerol-3-phosphate acyltransferase